VGGASLTTVWLKRAVLTDDPGIEESHHDSHQRPAGRIGFSDLIRIRLTWFAFAFLFFSTMGFGALQNFGPSILGRLYGLSLAAATSGLTAYLFGSAAGLATGGFLAGGKSGQEKLVGIAFLCSAAIAFLLSLSIVPAGAVIGLMAAMGFGVGMASPSRDMLVRKSTAARFGPGIFGRMAGLVYSGADAALATSPLVFGALMDAGSTRTVLIGVSAALLIAIVAAKAIAAEVS
jgi:MFS family permease